MPDQTMTLREVARRLALIKSPKARGIDTNKLHSLLRAGELRAGFYILEGKVWIDVPISHWEATPSNKIRERISRKGSSPGSYNVRPGQFPDQIAYIICDQPILDTVSTAESPIKRDLVSVSSVVTAVIKQYEVTVKEAVYLDYLNRHNIEDKKKESTGGRHRKEGWREVCSYMAAYLVNYDRTYPGQKPDLLSTSNRILELAKLDEVPNLPAWSTLKAEVSKALRLCDKPEFRIKK